MHLHENPIPYLSNIRTPYKQKQLCIWAEHLIPRGIHIHYAESRHTLGWVPESLCEIRETIVAANPFKLWRLIREASEAKVVLLGGYFFWQAWLIWLAHFFCGFKCVMILDGVAPSGLISSQKDPLKKSLKQFFLRHCSGFLANGQISRKLLLLYGIRPELIYQQYLTVDLELLHAMQETSPVIHDELKSKWQLQPKQKIIRYCGRLVQRKRVDDLIRAAAIVNIEQPVQLLITGSGMEFDNLRKLAGDLNVPTVFTGAITDQAELFRLYSICDLAVLPSENEPWGLVAMEAVAMGIPLILSSDCGCAEDLVVPGRNGFVYPLGDITQLAECICEGLALPIDAVREQSRQIEKSWNYESSARQLCLCLRNTCAVQVASGDRQA